MASEEHRKLAMTIKNTHWELRNLSSVIGVEEAWKQHMADENTRKIYAQTMRHLAENHWKDNSTADDRIQWTITFCDNYFQYDELERWKLKDLKIIEKLKEEGCNNEVRTGDDLASIEQLEALDVGSSGNFFKCPRFNMIPIDISPSHESVFICDFLSVPIEDRLQCGDTTIKTLPSNYFHVVIFSLLLEYLPSSTQRIRCCEKAFQVLRTHGILVIITPDSNHELKNSKQIKNWRWTLAKIGFQRIKVEKLRNLTCMAFRKTTAIEIPRRWANSYRESYMEFCLEIPQDKSKAVDHLDKHPKSGEQEHLEFEIDLMDELPNFL